VPLQRLKEAARSAGFDLRGGKVTPAPPGETKEGWSEKKDGWTWYVPLYQEERE
jgi:hypothetical protein